MLQRVQDAIADLLSFLIAIALGGAVLIVVVGVPVVLLGFAAVGWVGVLQTGPWPAKVLSCAVALPFLLASLWLVIWASRKAVEHWPCWIGNHKWPKESLERLQWGFLVVLPRNGTFRVCARCGREEVVALDHSLGTFGGADIWVPVERAVNRGGHWRC